MGGVTPPAKKSRKMTPDQWWEKRVKILQDNAAKVAHIRPDVYYEKTGFWPLKKLVLMQYALGFYGPIMRKQPWVDRLHFVDLCSGSGLTKCMPKDAGDGGRPLLVTGTALIGAQAVLLDGREVFDEYHFVEVDEEAAAALSDRLSAVLRPGSFHVHPMKAAEAIPIITARIDAASTKPHVMTFADPEGLTEVTLPALAELLAHRGDLMMNYQYQAVTRVPEARANEFFGRADWPRTGGDDAMRRYLHRRLADLGRPATKAWTVRTSQATRYAYEMLYCAPSTQGGNVWLSNMERELAERWNAVDGRSLEDVLFRRGLRRFQDMAEDEEL